MGLLESCWWSRRTLLSEGEKEKDRFGQPKRRKRVEGVLLERECTQAEEYSGNVRERNLRRKSMSLRKFEKFTFFATSLLLSFASQSLGSLSASSTRKSTDEPSQSQN